MRLAAQDEVHLRSEVVVPKATIGRIIGKGGQNVSGLEPVMLATLHLCECLYLGFVSFISYKLRDLNP